MTKHIHKLAQQLQPMMAAGDPAPVVRDAWASLVRWHQAGERVHRLTPHDVEAARSGLPLDLPLASAPIRAAGLLYVIERRLWLVVARHAAREPYPVRAGVSRAYAEPMLTYATEVNGGLASGAINLRDSPTPAQLRIYPGTSLGEHGARAMDRDEISTEIVRLAQCLPHFYRQ